MRGLRGVAGAQAREALAAGNEGLTSFGSHGCSTPFRRGRLFLALFFLALSCAAMSSVIAMVRAGNQYVQRPGHPRRKAVPLIGMLAFLLGLPSAWKPWLFPKPGLGVGFGPDDFRILHLFLGHSLRSEPLSKGPYQHARGAPARRALVHVRYFLCRPIEFVTIIAWWFYQAATVYDPTGWWNPFHISSVGTCLLQWGLLILLLLLVNRSWTARGCETRRLALPLSGYIMMTIVLVGVWGGFVYFLYRTIKQNRQ